MSNIVSNFVIDNGVFKKYCGNEKNINIPFGITVIGEGSFEETPIESIVIPNSITNIETGAFWNCKALDKIVFSNNITSVDKNAFAWGKSCKSVYISDLTSWCNIDFKSYTSNPLSHEGKLYLNGKLLDKLVIPDDINIIKQYAFKGCFFNKLIIHDNVTEIRTGAFLGCESFKSVIIPSSVNTIDKQAFSYCNSLTEIIFKGEPEYIDENAFYCSEIKTVKVCSEKMKKLLNNILPAICEIIIDTSLNEKDNITLGAEYLETETNLSSEDNESLAHECEIENCNELI